MQSLAASSISGTFEGTIDSKIYIKPIIRCIGNFVPSVQAIG